MSVRTLSHTVALAGCILLHSTIITQADVVLTSVTPGEGAIIGTSTPDLVLDFSGAIDVATATTDSVRLYRLGENPLTPSDDDTLIPLASITPELGGTRLRITTDDPLADGNYAWVIYGSRSTRSGPGSGLAFSHNIAYFEEQAFKTLGEEFTLEAWTRWDSLPSGGSHAYGAIYDIGKTGRYVPGFWVSHESQDIKFGYRLPSEQQNEAVAEDVLVEGEWIHVAAVSSTDGMKLYINGELTASLPDTFRPDSFATDIEVALTGYSRWAGAYDYCVGLFDEYRVWNVARTQAEIQETMHTPLSGSELGLLIYHPLDDISSGDVLVDASGHGCLGSRGSAVRTPSEAPLIDMAWVSLRDMALNPVDMMDDGTAGGVLVSPFRVDGTAPTIVAIEPMLDVCPISLQPGEISVTFDDQMDVSTFTPVNVWLMASGGDGTFGDGNEQYITFSSFDYDADAMCLTLTPATPLVDEDYLLTIQDGVQNETGFALDGEYPGPGGSSTPLPTGDGTLGGDFAIEFAIDNTADCNNNGTADACELDGNDLNGNGIPDDCEDCNRNGILDECDIDCGTPGEYCDIPGCGLSGDCNANGVLDECDISPQSFALQFDGSNDYVRVPRHSALEPASLTVEMWARLGGQQSRNTRLLRKYSGSGYIFAADQDYDQRMQLRVNGAEVKDTQSHSAYVGEWHHFAGVYTPTSMKLYVDGELVNTIGHANGPLTHADIDLYFASGKPSSDGSEYFQGTLDDIRIWSDERTQEELQDNMHVMLSGTEADLVGYWRLDEGAGQYAADGSIYGNTGILGSSESPISDPSDPVWFGIEEPGVEYLPDCNVNGTPDVCDLDPADPDGDGLVSDDCNENDIPDECEIFGASLAMLEQAIECPFNGHYYLLTDSAMTWDNCEAAAISLGGHLATVRSGEENQWLYDTFSGPLNGASAYVGYNDILFEGTWVWSSGEGTTYTNWESGQPDNNFDEDWCEINMSTSGYAGQWNDDDQQNYGIIELIPTNDCNENGILDECEIADGTSEDCNENGIPDECEFAGTVDCNDNGITDLCEPGGAEDCNHNGIPDWCDLRDGTSDDCNENGIPDDCDGDLGNKELSFDGIDDLVSLPLNLVKDSTTLTFEAWFRTSSGGVIFGYQNVAYPASPSNYTPAVYVGNDGLLRAEFYTGSAESIITSDSVVNDNDWHHVALSANVDTQSLYLDGVLVDSLSGSIIQLDQHYNQVGIGHGHSHAWPSLEPGWQAFEGAIDDVRLWYVARSEEEIRSTMDVLPAGPHTGLVGRWRFNEGIGQLADDASGNGNDGILGCDVASEGDASDPMWAISDSPDLTEDCNENGILDQCDIADETSDDCNEDGIPDECETGGTEDCNTNGVPDLCDIYSGTSQDCQVDGIPDDCQLVDNDCNANGIPDECEPDCNENGIPDECDLDAGTSDDCNENDVPDECDTPMNALDFDGADDIVRVPRSESLEPTDELTIEVWVYPESTGSYHSRIVRKAAGTGYILAWQQSGDGRAQLRIDGAVAGNVAVKDTLPTSSYLEEWHHLAGAYSASGNYARLYVDGVLKAELPAVGTLYHSVVDLNIGNYGSSEDFDGLVDEVRIWNVARTEAQIQTHMDLPLSGDEPGLIGYWAFNEGEGQVVHDSSLYGNDGYLGSTDDPSGETSDPTWVNSSVPELAGDCNNNGILDECDIADGTSDDCNENGMPDECEFGGSEDCNTNGTADLCDIYTGTSDDCQFDGIPDECQLVDNDCNANGVPDECEAGGTTDCNENEVPDLCDIYAGTSLDCNTNAVPDECDIADGTSTDVNEDSIPDDCQPDVQVMPVISLLNPAWTAEVATELPGTLTSVAQGNRYYVEIWASDVGEDNSGLFGVVVDMTFCTNTIANELFHGTIFDEFPLGTILTGHIDEFGGAAIPTGGGIEPEWVRVGWIEMNAGLPAASCPIALEPSLNGISRVGHGNVDWAFIELGSVDLEITPSSVTYDLDGDTFIGVSDLFLFSQSWLQTVPPGNPAHDFNCDGFVGPGDLSWFATGWQKYVDDPTILLPPCPDKSGGSRSETSDVEMRLIAVSSPSASDETTTLPASIDSVSLGATYYVEAWVSDVGVVNSGLTSAYTNVLYPYPAASVQDVVNTSAFSYFDSGADDGTGIIESLGGSTLPGGVGIAPTWVRVGLIEVKADATAPTAVFAVEPSVPSVAALARDAIAWTSVSQGTLSVRQGLLGDIDSDGDKDIDDIDLFVAVLLGAEPTAAYLVASDFNGDRTANGLDTQLFVEALMTP